MRASRKALIFGKAALLVAVAAGSLTAKAVAGLADSQEPPAAPVSPADASAAKPVSSAKAGKQKYSHANDFLIHGTVFNDKAMAFPAVEIRIRRNGEKRFRWHDLTNSRGDFAMRVPGGAPYEIVVHVKGFVDQRLPVDAMAGAGEQNTAFRMVPSAGGGK